MPKAKNAIVHRQKLVPLDVAATMVFGTRISPVFKMVAGRT